MFVCETHREELGKLKGELHQLMGCTQFLSRAFRHLQCLNAVQTASLDSANILRTIFAHNHNADLMKYQKDRAACSPVLSCHPWKPHPCTGFQETLDKIRQEIDAHLGMCSPFVAPWSILIHMGSIFAPLRRSNSNPDKIRVRGVPCFFPLMFGFFKNSSLHGCMRLQSVRQ